MFEPLHALPLLVVLDALDILVLGRNRVDCPRQEHEDDQNPRDEVLPGPTRRF